MCAFGVSAFFTANAAASAAVGGLLLGVTVAFKTRVVGRVLGISTYTKRLFVQPSADRVAMIFGLILAGFLMAQLYGGAMPMPPPGISAGQRSRLLPRFVAGGLLLGTGATLQNGCTSGHGLTGLARFSPRSWVAVPVFMAAGVATASLSRSASALPADADTEATVPAWPWALLLAACVAAALAALAAGLPWLVQRWGVSDAAVAAQKTTTILAELAVGLSFGCGLVLSGMARPSKVLAFLDVASGQWDPSLGIVMGSALLVTVSFFQALRLTGAERALLGGDLDLPPRTGRVDARLLTGAAIFGAGWGTCGLCPGPAWVAAGAMPSYEVVAVVLGMLASTAVTASLQSGNGKVCPGTQAAPADGASASETATVADDGAGLEAQSATYCKANSTVGSAHAGAAS